MSSSYSVLIAIIYIIDIGMQNNPQVQGKCGKRYHTSRGGKYDADSCKRFKNRSRRREKRRKKVWLPGKEPQAHPDSNSPWATDLQVGDSNLELVSDVISSRRRSISPEPHSCPRHVEQKWGLSPFTLTSNFFCATYLSSCGGKEEMAGNTRKSIICYCFISKSLTLKFRAHSPSQNCSKYFSRFLQNILISLEIFCFSKKLITKFKGLHINK